MGNTLDRNVYETGFFQFHHHIITASNIETKYLQIIISYPRMENSVICFSTLTALDDHVSVCGTGIGYLLSKMQQKYDKRATNSKQIVQYSCHMYKNAAIIFAIDAESHVAK